MKKAISITFLLFSIFCISALAQDLSTNNTAVQNVQPVSAVAENSNKQINEASVGATIEEYQYKTGAFDLSYPHFSGMDNFEAQDKINKEIEAVVAKFIEDNNNTMTTTAVIKYKVNYLSQDLASVTVTKYTYTGGAHGASFMEGYTYDLKTGLKYGFSDLFQFDSTAIADINKQITDQIKERQIPTFGPFQGVSDKPSFFIGHDGRPVLFFQQYEIGPYSVGILKFPVMAAKL